MSKLIGNEYFEKVAASMQEKGFRLFAQVAISNDDAKYHVPVTTARATSLFFHIPNRNCIISLVYYENDFCEFEGYWHLRVDLKFASFASMTTALYPQEEGGDEVEDFQKFDYGKEVYCAGFRHAGWSMSHGLQKTWNLDQEYPHTAPLEPVMLVGRVKDMVNAIIPHLEPSPFDELQVTGWPPAYVFRDCAPIFWERFKESSSRLSSSKYLWSLVARPWGSEGLER
jgi:hypothetical protein